MFCVDGIGGISGSWPARACASNSGENHRASWLLVGEADMSRLTGRLMVWL